MNKSIYTREYETFLRSLRDARLRAGLTQVQLAERLGQTQTFVSKCERGERRLDLMETRVFCVAIGIAFPRFIADLERTIAGSL